MSLVAGVISTVFGVIASRLIAMDVGYRIILMDSADTALDALNYWSCFDGCPWIDASFSTDTGSNCNRNEKAPGGN
jgi:hypothetical protein